MNEPEPPGVLEELRSSDRKLQVEDCPGNWEGPGAMLATPCSTICCVSAPNGGCHKWGPHLDGLHGKHVEMDDLGAPLRKPSIVLQLSGI